MSRSARVRSHWLARAAVAGAPLALPALVWLVGSFYFLGRLGKWIDDYGAHLRDPATGAIRWGEMLVPQWWFFWRPIHIQLIYWLQTLFYNHDWVNHLFSALMHALACFGLWKFLRECGIGRCCAACAAVVMLGSVQGFEAVFWPATVSTSIATAAFFWAAVLVVRHAGGREGTRAVVALGVLGFVIPCLYEQQAAALAATPVLYLAAARPGARRGTWWNDVGRMVVALAPCGVAVLVYVALFVVTVRADRMARESQFGRPEEVWPHALFLLKAMGLNVLPFLELGGLWDAGVRTLRGSWIGLFGWGALAGATMGAWVWAWWSERRDDRAADHGGAMERRRVHPGALVVFGVLCALLSLVPIAAITGAGISPRLAYFPLACALMALAGGLDLAVGRIGRIAAIGRTGVALGAGVLAVVGSVYMVGAQWHMRHRYEADGRMMRSLRRAIPNPAPGTLLVPMRWEPDPEGPTTARPGGSFQPIWMSPWAINTEVKRVYGSDEVHAAAVYSRAEPTAIVRLGDPSIIAWSHYMRYLPTPRKDTVCPEFPLALIVPFTIDARQGVTLVSAIVTGRADGTTARMEFPQAVAAAKRGVATRELAMAFPMATGRPWVLDWVWTHGEGGGTERRKVGFKVVASWGAADCAARMHPPVAGVRIADGDTDQMEVSLAEANRERVGRARRFVFHATFDESVIDLNVLGDGVDLVWTVDGTELQRKRLDPRAIRASRAWETVTVDVPAGLSEGVMRVTVGPGPSGNPSYDRVLVTCGEEDLTVGAGTSSSGVPAP